MLRTHPTEPLEYWFFKVNHGRTALLVDWICQRATDVGVVRISIHSPVGGEVLFSPHPAILRHGAPELAMQETAWRRGSVRWHLAIEASPDRIRPRLFPAEQLKLFDMSLESAPSATFDGWIEHQGERFPVDHASGMLSHYWGRQLPEEWWWLSANQFANAEVSVECTVLRSRVWGTRMSMPLGYLYYRNGSRRRLIISPPGKLKAAGSPDSFEVRAASFGGPVITLKAKGRDYHSLGEDIFNTLTGDLEVWEGDALVAQCSGAAGLERRKSSASGAS